jgi:hypothetical protein
MTSKIRLVLLAFVALCVYAPPARAQLITLTRDYRVLSVDQAAHVIHVSKIDGDTEAGKIIVAPDTRLYVFNREIPSFSWQLLQKGMRITVKGGLTWDLKIKAKQIYL